MSPAALKQFHFKSWPLKQHCSCNRIIVIVTFFLLIFASNKMSLWSHICRVVLLLKKSAGGSWIGIVCHRWSLSPSSKWCLLVELSSVRTSVINVYYTEKERILTFQQMYCVIYIYVYMGIASCFNDYERQIIIEDCKASEPVMNILCN